MLADLPFFGGFSKRQSLDFNSEDLINMFMINDLGGKKQHAFIALPGLSYEFGMGGGTGRQLYTLGNFMYGVSGNNVSRINTALVPTIIGSIGTDVGYVSVTSNNKQQIIFVDGQSGYLYDSQSGVFNKITADGFPTQPLNVVFLDGFFVIPSGGDEPSYQISALNDGSKWDAIDTVFIQTYPGKNVGVGVVNERLFFFKTTSTEVWYNAGQADFPFRKDSNLLFNFGCLTAASIASGFGYLFWLARDEDGVGSVMMTMGDVPTAISNEAVEDLIQSFIAPSDMTAYVYKDLKHVFYVMSWTTDDVTLIYDVNSQIWQRMEMEKHLPVAGQIYSGKVRHLSSCHAFFNNTHFVGSYKDDSIYNFSRAFFSNDTGATTNEPMRRVRECSNFFDPNYRKIQTTSIQLDMKMGLGFSTGTGVYDNSNDDPLINPQVYLDVSRDGGSVFGNSRPAPLGKIGNRRSRAIYRKLGTSRTLIPRFTVYAPVGPIAMLGASINYEVLAQ